MKALLLVALAAFASAQGTDPYTQFLTGLLTTLEPSVGGQVAPCIVGTTGGISSVRIGLGLIENGLATGNVTQVFEGALQFQVALTDIKEAAASCGFPTVQADIQKIIDSLQNNPLGVLAALFPYLSTVSTDLQNAIVDFKSGNYTAAGSDIGSVLVIILTDAVSAKRTLKADSAYVQFLTGLLTTLEPAVGGKVAPCLANAGGSYQDIRNGILLLKQAVEHRNITAGMDGLKSFEQAFLDVKSAAIQCGVPAVATDMTTLITEITTNPLGVAFKLLPHVTDIIADVAGMWAALQGGNPNLAGQDLGSILALILAA